MQFLNHGQDNFKNSHLIRRYIYKPLIKDWFQEVLKNKRNNYDIKIMQGVFSACKSLYHGDDIDHVYKLIVKFSDKKNFNRLRMAELVTRFSHRGLEFGEYYTRTIDDSIYFRSIINEVRARNLAANKKHMQMPSKRVR